MKPIINRIAPHSGMIFLPLLFLWQKKKIRLTLILSLSTIILTGCFKQFFRTGTLNGIDTATIQRLQSEKKYFILHSSNGVWAMDNLKVKNNKIEADLDSLSEMHSKYLYPNAEKANALKKYDKLATLVEVHMNFS